MGVPDGGEREQGIENLCEKVMMVNFPNLMMEIDIQVQKEQRVPNKMTSKRPTPRHIIIKIATIKDKERMLKATKEKQLVTYEGAPIRLSADFSTETADQKGLARNIQSDGRQGLTTKITLPSKGIFRIKGQILHSTT